MRERIATVVIIMSFFAGLFIIQGSISGTARLLAAGALFAAWIGVAIVLWRNGALTFASAPAIAGLAIGALLGVVAAATLSGAAFSAALLILGLFVLLGGLWWYSDEAHRV